jgi:voltage-gated potassium channel
MRKNSADTLNFLNLLILFLSFYVLFALLIDTLFVLPEETSRMLHMIDNIICGVFFIDFIIRFRKATNKLQFMKWGWIDLIASIPMLDFMRAGRLFRLVRLIRLVRAFRSVRHVVNHVFINKVKGAFTSVILLAILVLMFSSIAILQFETDPESNIKTAEDALWWTYVTMTTVGYGDKYPVTTEGRIVAAILMTVGVGLFGTFTAFVSSWFLKSEKAAIDQAETKKIAEQKSERETD